MKARANLGRWMSVVMVALVGVGLAQPLQGQGTKMPSTLRYGSGFFNVPAATTLPHMAITGTYSGFGINLDDRVLISGAGFENGRLAEPLNQWSQDGSVAVGLFDRVELGATFQNFADADSGGNMVGGFGRVALVQPETAGVGLAVGARFVSGPSFGDAGHDYMPTRLGFPDNRFYGRYEGGYVEEVSTKFSPYMMGSFGFAGLDADFLPSHDFTFGLGYGGGMFGGSGRELGWYGQRSSHGLLAASALHVQLSEGVLLHVMGEYDGWDVNAGVQLDAGGIRVGAHMLGAQNLETRTEYRGSRYGILASLALCPGTGLLCSPGLTERPEPVQLPAPPPDTVIIERTNEVPIPLTEERTLCLATGESATVLGTPEGAELISLSALGGAYAGEAEWFNDDSEIEHAGNPYEKAGGEVSPDCGTITRVGEWMGVPLFAESAAMGEDRLPMVYVPVSPGRWQPYELPARVRG